MQFEISLTTADTSIATQQVIQAKHYKDIKKHLQETINKANLDGKPQLEDVTKLKRGVIRLTVVTKEGANKIREANIN